METATKNIHLNLLKGWFDMVYRGAKCEEYRELTPYWCKILTDKNGKLKQFDTITFSNGYSKDRRQFVIECKSVKIAKGLEEWGAKPNTKYFTFYLGQIVRKNF